MAGSIEIDYEKFQYIGNPADGHKIYTNLHMDSLTGPNLKSPIFSATKVITNSI